MQLVVQAMSFDYNKWQQEGLALLHTYGNKKALAEMYKKNAPAVWKAAQVITVATIVANILLPNTLKRKMVKWAIVGRFFFYRASKKIVPPPPPPPSAPFSHTCKKTSSRLKTLSADVQRMRHDIDLITQYIKMKPMSDTGPINFGSYQPQDINQSMAAKIDALFARFEQMQGQFAAMQRNQTR